MKFEYFLVPAKRVKNGGEGTSGAELKMALKLKGGVMGTPQISPPKFFKIVKHRNFQEI